MVLYIPQELSSRSPNKNAGAFDLNDGLVGADGVVAVLEVEAEGNMGAVLEEDIADGTVDDVVDERALYNRPSGQRCR